MLKLRNTSQAFAIDILSMDTLFVDVNYNDWFLMINTLLGGCYNFMEVNINYQVILRSKHIVKGAVKSNTNQTVQSLKNRILQQEGIKNQDSFIANSSEQITVTKDLTRLQIHEQAEKEKKPKSVSQRIISQDSGSVFEAPQVEYEDQARQFLAVQPERPPTIRGRVQKCNKFFCCFSSVVYLQLSITSLKFYSNNKYQQSNDSVSINNIRQIRSYRKKDYFFIELTFVDDQSIDLKFTSANLCKEWMGYLMQSMTFNKYLKKKQTFSRADSFKNFINSLKEENQNTRIVTLQESNKQLRTIHGELPQENTIIRQSKKFTKISQFDIKYKVGKGTFSTIYLAERKNKIYALKQLKKQELLLRNQMKYAMTELKALIKCRKCKYVIPLYFAFQTPEYLYLTLQYVPTGDLNSYIKDYGPFSPENALIILAQLVYTIQFLHKQKIIYRDLKPENIMIDSKGHIFLIDFGLSKQLDNSDDYAESFLGTPLYLAPQRFKEGGGSINFKSDIYGVGCVFYEMLHGESPFHSTNIHSLVNKIRNQTPEISKKLPEDFIFFIMETLQKDPQKRILTMSKHKIFKNTNWKQIAQKSHKGIKTDLIEKSSSVSINYKLDEDYNELTFPLKFVSDWQFDSEHNK